MALNDAFPGLPCDQDCQLELSLQFHTLKVLFTDGTVCYSAKPDCTVNMSQVHVQDFTLARSNKDTVPTRCND